MRKAVVSVGKSHNWKKVSEVVVGDYIHRAGDDLKVLRIEQPNKYVYRVTVLEPWRNGEEQEYRFENTADLLVKVK